MITTYHNYTAATKSKNAFQVRTQNATNPNNNFLDNSILQTRNMQPEHTSAMQNAANPSAADNIKSIANGTDGKEV